MPHQKYVIIIYEKPDNSLFCQNWYVLFFSIMILRVEHIGIAVADEQAAREIFDRLLGKSPYKTEDVTSEAVRTIFYDINLSKLELLKDTKPEGGTISKFVEKRGTGMHHIALEVDDIYEEIERLKADGFAFVNDVPKEGADNKLICFLHPKSTNGVLVELCQERVP